MKKMDLTRASSVASALGGTAEFTHTDHQDLEHFRLRDDQGRTFYLSHVSSGANRGRLAVSGDWPAKDGSKRGVTIFPSEIKEDAPQITVSPDKTEQQIAQDIQRRFLPEFQRIFDLCKARGAELMAHEAKEFELKSRISGALGKAFSGREMEPGGRLHIYGIKEAYFRDVYVSSYNSSVSGTFSGISVDKFTKILQLLQEADHA